MDSDGMTEIDREEIGEILSDGLREIRLDSAELKAILSINNDVIRISNDVVRVELEQRSRYATIEHLEARRHQIIANRLSLHEGTEGKGYNVDLQTGIVTLV